MAEALDEGLCVLVAKVESLPTMEVVMQSAKQWGHLHLFDG